MATDLSHLARGSFSASSMAAGNMISSNRIAQTAPGSPPVDPLQDRQHQGDPSIIAENYDTATVLRGPSGQAERVDNADRGDMYSIDDGSGAWKSAQRSLGLPERPRWSHGRVNHI